MSDPKPTPPKQNAAAGCGCLALIVVAIVVGCSSMNSGTSSSNTSVPPAAGQEQNAQPDIPPVQKEPIKSTAQLKHEFAASVDESISGQRIMGAKYKFVGENVDLHGKVLSIVDENHFNLGTGSMTIDDDGNVLDTSGTIVVQCESTHDLERNQQVRVLGTVIQPIEGNNVMGGNATFAAVEAKYIE